MDYRTPLDGYAGNSKLTQLTDRISSRHFKGNGDSYPMLKNAPVQSLVDAGFGMGADVRGVVFMMITTTITTRMRGGGG